ncbi:MAG: enoyl-CoA hydratase-related protein, partial [Gammaproteobacteria bacterium]
MSDYNNINNNYGLIYKVNHLQQIATITFNKPEIYNALNLEMIQQLSKYYQQVNNDPKIKLLIINANGTHFSSGADLNWMKNVQNYTIQQNLQNAKQLANMLLLLYNLSKPVLCAVQG